jgi:tetratricopeptide (TPR) repeat protein
MRRAVSFLASTLIALTLALPAYAGDAQWVEVRSPNFRVVTDAGEKRGREVALRFEQMRAIFGTLFQRAKVQTSVPLQIIAFRSSKQMRQVSPLWNGKAVELAGFFQPGDGVAFIALDLSSENRWEAVFHEYAHMLLEANSINTQLWFDEGFAEYFSTAKVRKKDFEIGYVPEHVPYVLSSTKLIPLEQFFSVDQRSQFYNERDRKSVFYSQAWLAMNYFWFNQENRAKLNKYLLLVEQQVPIRDAVQQAFGVAPNQLDKELDKYFRTGRASVYRYSVPISIQESLFTVRPLDPTDAHALISELRLQMSDYSEQALAEFEQILQQKPDHSSALRGLGYGWLRKGEFDKAGEYFRRAAALDSSDARVHYYSAVLMERMGAERKPELLRQMRAALEKAVKLDPELADAHHWLSLTYAWERKFEEAIPHVKRAIELKPRNEHYAFNLAGYLMTLEKFDEASALCQRLARSADSTISSQAQQMLASIEQVRQIRASMASPRRSSAPASGKLDVSRYSTSEPEWSSADPDNPEAPLRYFAGKLLKVECPARQEAVFFVLSGNTVLRLESDNIEEVSFAGTSNFSCSWRDRKVEGFYRQPEPNSRVLIALELK